MIYISLTTVPLRLTFWEELKTNLDSLLNQKTDKEYYVIFSIPMTYAMNEDEEYILPDGLLEYAERHPRLIINRETPDYGPIVKVIGGLKYATEPDDILIVCDDDQIYHEEMLEYHVKKLNEHPTEIICFRGDQVVDKREYIDPEDGIKKFVLRNGHIHFPVNRDTFLLIPGHWHSVGYFRRYFEDDFFDENFWKMANGDDILIGYYCRLHNILIRCVRWDKETDFRPILDEAGYKPCYTFPIVAPVPMPQSGGWLIRMKHPHDGNHGFEAKEVQDVLYSYHKHVYIDKDKKFYCE